MPHNKDLQKKLHETRFKILQLQLEINDLKENRGKHLTKIRQIDAKILALEKKIAAEKSR